MQSQRLRPEDIINASDVAGFDMGALDMSEQWISWLSKFLGVDVSSLPVEMIPFIPSPTTVDCPFLGTTADFIDNDLDVPLAFRGGEDGHAGLEKLFELAAFNGKLLLARLRLAMDRGRGFNEDEWRKRIQMSISLPTIDRVFWNIPKSLIAPIPASAFPMTVSSWAQREHARLQGVVNWILNEARTKPKDEIVTPILNILPNAHPSVRTYVNATRLLPVLPDITHMITDLYVARTSPSPSARAAANSTLRPFLEQLRATLGELGDEWVESMTLGTWSKEEMQLVTIAITEQGGENGKMSQREVNELFRGLV